MVKKTKKDYDRERYLKIKTEKESRKPKDKILLLSDVDCAYIAGLIDGEGSLYISAVGPNRRKTVYPVVVVAMTEKPVIEWLKEVCDSGNIQLHNQTNLRKYPYMKPQYRFNLFGKRAQLLCKRIHPYLKVKKEQAEIIMSFVCDVRIAPGVKISKDINEVRLELRDRCNALNHSNRFRPNINKRKFFGMH